MAVNREVVISAATITAIGVYRDWTTKQGIGKVLTGGYVLMLVLGLVDTIGGQTSFVVGKIALLAMFSGVMYFLATSNILGTLGTKVGVNKTNPQINPKPTG